jgi:DNA-binding NtrC family response regulator
MASILIVDDEKSIRTMLASYMRTVGHDVEVAENGKAALEMLARTAVDLVFSDVRMAELDGMVLLREIRGRWPDIVVVLMTAYATVPQAVEAIQAGAYDYLMKPFSIEQLGRILDRALEVHGLQAPAGVPALDTMADRSLSFEHLQRKHIARVVAESVALEEAAARLDIRSTTLSRTRKRYGIE